MTLSPTEWLELRALLERALDATAEERARLLADLERTDPARGRELAELLRADGLESSALDAGVSPWLEAVADGASPGDGDLPGTSLVGPPIRGALGQGNQKLSHYRIGRRLGAGGLWARSFSPTISRSAAEISSVDGVISYQEER